MFCNIIMGFLFIIAGSVLRQGMVNIVHKATNYKLQFSSS